MAIDSANRPVRVTSTLGKDKLLLMSMSGSEQLSRLFRYELELLSDDANIKADDLLGTKMDVIVDDGQTQRYFNGHVARFSFAGYDSSGAMFKYRATLMPWLWFLTRTADCRIFQEMTVIDVIKEVFNENPHAQFEDRLSGNHSTRTWEYCVQYRETDFNFISRLLEQEGIYYYFKHEETKHTLVLADSQGSHDGVPDHDTIKFLYERKNVTEHGVLEWGVEHEFPTGQYAMRDFNFTDPKPAKLQSVAPSALQTPGISDYEMYDYPGEYTKSGEGDTYSKMRMEELECQHAIASGETNVRSLSTGQTFTLENYKREDQNKKYLITGATYRLQSDISAGEGAGGGGDVYHCNFNVIDVKQQYRPRRVTPKPVVQGPQTAIVSGSDDITVDEHGRVKVQFHWDRYGESDQNSSCWVRVSQNWAGKEWGGIFIPHVGQEVIVDFLEGDPDHPIIIGRVYNGDQTPPQALPDNKNKSIIKDNYGNQIILDATPGDEHIHIFSPHHTSGMQLGKSVKTYTNSDWDTTSIGNTYDTRYGNAISTTWGSKHSQTFGANTSVFGGFDAGLWVGGGFSATVGVKMGLSLAGTFDAGAGGKYSFFLGPNISAGSNNHTTSVNKNITMDANGTIKMIGGGNDNTIVEGDSKELTLRYETGGSESDVDSHWINTFKALAMTVAGLGVAGAAAMVTVGAAAGTAESREDDARANDPTIPASNYDADATALKTAGFALGGTILGGGVAVGAGYGAYKLWRKLKDKKKKADEKKADRHGLITLDEDGVLIEGVGGKQGATDVTSLFLPSKKQASNIIVMVSQEGDVRIKAPKGNIELIAKDKITLDAKEVFIKKNVMKSTNKNIDFK